MTTRNSPNLLGNSSPAGTVQLRHSLHAYPPESCSVLDRMSRLTVSTPLVQGSHLANFCSAHANQSLSSSQRSDTSVSDRNLAIMFAPPSLPRNGPPVPGSAATDWRPVAAAGGSRLVGPAPRGSAPPQRLGRGRRRPVSPGLRRSGEPAVPEEGQALSRHSRFGQRKLASVAKTTSPVIRRTWVWVRPSATLLGSFSASSRSAWRRCV